MKRFLLFITLLAGSISFAHAQDDDADPVKGAQKIKALYVAYITQELSLTPAEAEKFWPLHKEFENEMNSIDPNLGELPREQKRLDIKKKYQDGFAKILGGTSRTDIFFRKDGEFRRKMVDRLKQIRQQNRQGQRPMRRNNL